MTTDPRIEAAAKAALETAVDHHYLRPEAVCTCSDTIQVGLVCDEKTFEEHVAEMVVVPALAAADAVDPLRNPTDADIDRAAASLYPYAFGEDRANTLSESIRERGRRHVRAVVAALRGGAA